jgi:ergothioneine biosynthesis protein EgtB
MDLRARRPSETSIPSVDRAAWQADYAAVRAHSRALARLLSAEDQAIQSMPDASPTKWHLAHTTWFFETFLLSGFLSGYEPFDPAFGFLFNSYYEALGERHPRAQRGMITRPDGTEVAAYRDHVDQAMGRLISGADGETWAAVEPLLALGLNHEQQHQELILMDIKHALSLNPLDPAYRAPRLQALDRTPGLGWHDMAGGLVEIGHQGEAFAFDNEGPRHKVWLEPFGVADRLTTCGEWAAFIEDGGYRDPKWWLSDGWAAVKREGWTAPLYWRAADAGWRIFTLSGLQMLDPNEPVCHVSFYEADAFARWADARLPTEAEWEVTAQAHPQIAGRRWQWTASAYSPYPRFRAADDPTGEYNGKFMSGQMVLRGHSSATPDGHSRLTYRNFFPPAARWAFSGVRLAKDV